MSETPNAGNDAVEWAIAQVESHPVRNSQTRAVTGFMLSAETWRVIRAALRSRDIPPGSPPRKERKP